MHGRDENALKNLVGKPEGKRPLDYLTLVVSTDHFKTCNVFTKSQNSVIFIFLNLKLRYLSLLLHLCSVFSVNT